MCGGQRSTLSDGPLELSHVLFFLGGKRGLCSKNLCPEQEHLTVFGSGDQIRVLCMLANIPSRL